MERVLFNRDLLTGCILPRLSIFDVFSVFQTCKGIREAYARQYAVPKETHSLSLHLFKQRLFNGLACFYGEKNAREIMSMLTEGLVFLTGGFLLATINGENIKACGDVDLATVIPSLCEKPKVTRRLCREKSAQVISMLSHAVKIRSNPWDGIFYEDGFSVDSYSVLEKKLQIIHLKEAEFYIDDNARVAHYCRWFDFQFCANFFAKNKLVCMFPLAVKERTTKIDPRDRPSQRFSHLTGEEEMILLNHMWERIAKYRAKGYHIDLSAIYPMVEGESPARIAIWNDFWSAKL